MLQAQWTPEQLAEARADLAEAQTLRSRVDTVLGPSPAGGRPSSSAQPRSQQPPLQEMSDEAWARMRETIRRRVGE
jgi:hypothetical protein